MTTWTPDTAAVRETGKAFSLDFLWGAATASYQIEGAANEDGRGESIWDRFSHTPGKVWNGDTGDVACDHYHRFPEDIALMKELGLQAYRFSIAWPRVFPTGDGPLNPKGLDFYNRLVDALLVAGIQPVPTLYHWDLPQSLEDRGGWPNLETARRFADYAETCFRSLGDRVEMWATLNEPWCSAHLGYVSGDHAPGRRDADLGLKAGHGLMVAHGLAVERFRAACPNGRIGIVVSVSPSHPASKSEADAAAARRADAYGNRWFLDPIFRGDYPAAMREAFGERLPAFTPEERAAVQLPIDFVGVNYYFRGVNGDDPSGSGLRTRWYPPSGGREETAMGWEIYPDGLTEILCQFDAAYDHPLMYVTENGAAFDDVVSSDGEVHDEGRRAYLESHFRAAALAIDRGANVGGYFVWSLLDNFEWGYGYSKRFGIVHVDYATQKRTLKSSAHWFADVIRRNAI
ncbi:MAG TPA: GH1 family beta-glucosidase [Armatimonadota bacterium]|jgi:beta-glucosidase